MTTTESTCLYAANRSPTGHATSLLCTLVDGAWGHLSETAPGERVTLPAGEALYATSEEAIAAARRRWNCERPRGRVERTRIPTPVLVTPLRCACGEWSGERCSWTGPRSETVLVEFMPEHLRASHEAAGNRGIYPANGSRRIRVERTCASSMVEQDGEWCEILP